MKNYAERFNSLEDLPVSEETLGAYLEGNLSADEELYLSELIESDPDLYMINDLAAEDFLDAPDDLVFPEEEFALLELPEDSLHEMEAARTSEPGAYDIVFEDEVILGDPDFNIEDHIGYDVNYPAPGEEPDYSFFDEPAITTWEEIDPSEISYSVSDIDPEADQAGYTPDDSYDNPLDDDFIFEP